MRIGRFDFSPRLLPTLATLALLPLLIALGVWQLGRAADKRHMQNTFTERVQQPAFFLDADAWSALRNDNQPQALAYLRVEMEGSFDGTRQYLLDNRTRNGVAGFEVLTAFRPDGADGGVIVNRGWVPQGRSRADLPPLPVPEQTVKLRGIIDAQREPLPLLGESGYERGGWPRIVQRIDMKAMADGLGYPLLPVTVLLDEDATFGFLREWKPYYGIPEERHQAYAVQWFALAAALVAIYVIVNTSRIENE